MSLTVTFVSNYINHHQIPFCEAMRRQIGDGFVFVQTQEMEEERLAMGWQDESAQLDWVVSWNHDRALAKSEIMSCDLLIAGWAPQAQSAVAERLQLHRPVFRISERIYKEGQWRFLSPRGLAAKYREYTRYRREPYFLLCAGAYVASDFRLIGAFPRRKYCWGYYPPMITYRGDRPPIRHRRAGDEAHLIWAGRFVAFKHVERVLSLADRLAKDGRRFILHIIGEESRTPEAGRCDRSLKTAPEHGAAADDMDHTDGGTSGTSDTPQAASVPARERRGRHRSGRWNASETAHRYVLEHGLDEYVMFHGFCTPQDVRMYMEDSDIFILTSDRGEGWGAVVNEAMNSGCAPVADSQAGAVPYLIKNGVNGYIYADGDEDDLVAKVERLIDDTQLCERFAGMSYRAIRTSWNAQVAAERFLQFGEAILDACDEAAEAAQQSGRRVKGLPMRRLNRDLPIEGPMSVAPLIRPYLRVPRMGEESK